MDNSTFFASVSAVSGVHIPRWNELPEFELYMDQVIGLAEKHLGALYVDGKGLLTPSMINNYVKSGVLPPPKNKRYGRTHLAILMIVCAMKPVMEISAVSDVLSHTVKEMGMETALNEFARLFEGELAAVTEKAELTAKTSQSDEILSFIAIENALKASAARTVAITAYEAMKPAEPKKDASEKPSKKEKEPSEKPSKKEKASSQKKKTASEEKTEETPSDSAE